MVIDSYGPQIGLKDIAAIEAELDVTLPAAYREFLLLYNGGTPTPDTMDVPGAPGTPTDVQVIFGIGRSAKTSNLSWNLSLIGERCPGHHLLPIACDSGGSLFCLRFEEGNASEVIYCDLDDPVCVFYPVATSFSDFVAKIRPFRNP